ncbi:MAG: cytidine deaminase [Bacteroidales bacterium]|nr:cytidine deaminase [Bacteroidales bacterium]
MDRSIEIRYEVFSSLDELSAADKELAKAAIAAQKTSYAPYSKFNVGAALLMGNGEIVPGSNQENAASPSGLCAERTAMFAAAVRYPGVPMKALAITGGHKMSICDEPATPCGGCRQVMAEYQKLAGGPISVLLIGARQIWKFARIDDLLPFIFTSLD